MKALLLAVLGGLVLLEFATAQAQAQMPSPITGHVTELEPTYMPEKFALQMDAGTTNFPAGAWLWWTGGTRGPDNVREMLAIAVAAIMSGKVVDFYISSNDKTCTGQFMHLNSTQ